MSLNELTIMYLAKDGVPASVAEVRQVPIRVLPSLLCQPGSLYNARITR